MQVGQQRGQLLAGVDVEAVERLVEDQQLRIAHQGLAQQGLTRFASGQILKAAVQQGADGKLFGKLRAAGRIFHLVLNNLRSGAACIFFSGAEQVGVIALPLVADQLLQLFEGETCYAGEVAFALTAEQGQVTGRARARADLPLPLLPTNAQLSPAATLRWSIFKVFVSLRRNVPCEICNDDMMYPIFCSDVHQGYDFRRAMSMGSA